MLVLLFYVQCITEGTVHPTESLRILLINWKYPFWFKKKQKTMEISGIFPGRIQEISLCQSKAGIFNCQRVSRAPENVARALENKTAIIIQLLSDRTLRLPPHTQEIHTSLLWRNYVCRIS